MEFNFFFLLLGRATGIVYVFSGVSKLVAHNTFLRTVQTLPLPFPTITKLVAPTLPWIELIVGILLITGAFNPYTAWISFTLLLIFSLIALYAVKKGIHVPCACFGTVLQETLSLKTVGRNSLFMLLILPLVLTKNTSEYSLDALLKNYSQAKFEDFIVVILLPIVTVGLATLVSVAQQTLSEISAEKSN